MMSAGERAYNRSLGAKPPAAVQGADPRCGSGGEAPPEADEVFCV